ncbi:MAG: GTP-binding protein [Candidatus Hodarchaeota archaeon]
MYGAILVVFLIILVLLLILIDAHHAKQQIEPNHCRICGRALFTPRTRAKRLCITHEKKYAFVSASIVPYKYWKKKLVPYEYWEKISAARTITNKKYDKVQKELEYLGFQYLFKTIAVGSDASSLIRRFADLGFRKSFIPTLGVDFATKVVKIGDKIIKLMILVIGSQKFFSRLRPYYYRGANGAIVCYDITSWGTFEAVDAWFNEISHHLGPIPRILVGNKMDLAENREVLRALAKAYAQEKGFPYIETSAKTDAGGDEMFLVLARKMLEAVRQFHEKPNSAA